MIAVLSFVIGIVEDNGGVTCTAGSTLINPKGNTAHWNATWIVARTPVMYDLDLSLNPLINVCNTDGVMEDSRYLPSAGLMFLSTIYVRPCIIYF